MFTLEIVVLAVCLRFFFFFIITKNIDTDHMRSLFSMAHNAFLQTIRKSAICRTLAWRSGSISS
jgi:hypothetical protein